MNEPNLAVQIAGLVAIVLVIGVFFVWPCFRSGNSALHMQRAGQAGGFFCGVLMASAATLFIAGIDNLAALTLPIVIAGAAMSNVGRRLATRYMLAHRETSIAEEPADLVVSTNNMLFSSTLRSRAFLASLVVNLAALAYVLFSWWSMEPRNGGFPVVSVAVMSVSAVVLYALGTIRVMAGSQGLRVNYGGLPLVRTHIRVRQMRSVEAIYVRPNEWGGWGYRGSLTLHSQAAVSLRRGPGLRIDLHDGRVFVVTVDDADIAAAVLKAKVAELSG